MYHQVVQNSDDTDGDAASGAASTHPAVDASASLRRHMEDAINYHRVTTETLSPLLHQGLPRSR